MNEQQSLLECILQENNDVQHNKLSHNEINYFFNGTAEQENDFEEYQEMTLQQFFYAAIQKTEQSYKQEAEEILVQIQQEQQKNAEYIREKEYYNSDAYVEKVARQQLGLVMPNEVLYVNNSKN